MGVFKILIFKPFGLKKYPDVNDKRKRKLVIDPRFRKLRRKVFLRGNLNAEVMQNLP